MATSKPAPLALPRAGLVHSLICVVRRFACARGAGPTIEFAISGLALIIFMLVLVNIGLLGFSIAAVDHGVQAAARRASVDAAYSYETSTASPQAYSCDAAVTIAGYFDSYADPPLSPSTTVTGGNPLITTHWINNTTSNHAGDPPGLFLTLTATYTWSPIGLAATGIGFTLRYTTLAMVTGTMTGTPSINATTCST